MRRCIAAVLLAGLCAGGCFRAPETVNVNLGGGGDGGSGGGGSWRDLAGQYAGGTFLDAEQGVLFYAYDTLAYPGRAIGLTASLRSAKNLRDLAGAEVGFFRDGRMVGRARTNADGMATIAWTPPREGNYEFTARILAPPRDDDYAQCPGVEAMLLVAAHERAQRFVVIDLDHTLVDAGFLKVLAGGARPMADSVRVATRLSGRYGVIYLTQRPDLLTRKSKHWLRANGYPVGPLLTGELKHALDSGAFKTARLKDLRAVYPNVAIGIGDKISDAQAYVDNGLTAYLIPHYKPKPKDLRKLAREIRDLRGRGRLHVVEDWRQIERGLFDGASWPPETFARMLERQADRLEREKKEED